MGYKQGHSSEVMMGVFLYKKFCSKMKLFAGLRGIIDEMHFKREADEV